MWANTTSISFSWICKIIMTATIFTFFKGFRCGEGRKSTNCWFCCKLMVEVVVFCANLLSLWKFPKRCWDLEQETYHRSNPHAYPISPRDNICSKNYWFPWSHSPIRILFWFWFEFRIFDDGNRTPRGSDFSARCFFQSIKMVNAGRPVANKRLAQKELAKTQQMHRQRVRLYF